MEDAISSEAPQPWWRRPWVQQLAVLVVVAGVWSGSFRNGFVYDDVQVIVKGERIHDPANLPGFFFHPTMWSAVDDAAEGFRVTEVDTYRPVTMTTFVWDAALSGRDPWSYHLTNLLLHLAVVAVWMGLLRRLNGGAWSLWLAGLGAWLGLHPLLAEAHVWINGRSDVVAGFWLGIALWSYLSGFAATSAARRWLGFGLGAFAFLLGCMSKEILLLALPVFPMLAWAQAARVGAAPWPWRRALLGTAPLLFGAAFYLFARQAAIGGLRAGGSWDQRLYALMRVPHLLVQGWGDVLIPTRLWMRELYAEYVHVAPWELALSAAALLGALVGAWLLRRRAPLLLVGVLGWCLTLAPAAMITTASGWWGFNRYLYVPLLLLLPGLMQVGGLLAASARPQLQRALAVLGVASLLVCGLLSLQVVANYRDPLSFYTAIIDGAPEAAHGYVGMGETLYTLNRPAEARSFMERGVELGPENPRAWNNLAAFLIDLGEMRQARSVAANGWRRWPASSELCNLTAITWMNDNVQHAAENLLICLQLGPNNASVLNNIQGVLQAHPQRAAYAVAFKALLERPEYAALQPRFVGLL